ncbi:MAG: hypothetical protein M1833_001297 [Piccolia ochrophora]|nr:MAG: hypothetical protein M1833_001297 [Piccolia ochrophora]
MDHSFKFDHWTDDICLHIRLDNDTTSFGGEELPSIISAWSASIPHPNCKGAPVAKMIQRRFTMPRMQSLCIWEDTGDSIARHIWDAGLMLADFLRRSYNQGYDGLQGLDDILRISRRSNVHVIELGTGCGIVGIALAQLLPKVRVVLTDLPDAMERVHTNIEDMPQDKKGCMSFHVVDWSANLPPTIAKEHFDLIVAADCTYNPSTAPSLVQTFVSLASSSPEACILVAMKVRHPAEAVFFELMKAGELMQSGHASIPLPTPRGEEDAVEEQCIDVYTFRRLKGGQVCGAMRRR